MQQDEAALHGPWEGQMNPYIGAAMWIIAALVGFRYLVADRRRSWPRSR
jgi:hypothetical protein